MPNFVEDCGCEYPICKTNIISFINNTNGIIKIIYLQIIWIITFFCNFASQLEKLFF